MIPSVAIRDFKCFQHAEVSDLKRVNLLVGENGSGKTAFLEALFLAAGASPALHFRTQAWRRGDGRAEIRSDRESYDAEFRDLFFGLDTTSIPAISFWDEIGTERSLRIRFRARVRRVQMDTVEPSPVQGFSYTPIVFEWSTAGAQLRSEVEISDSRISFVEHESNYAFRFLPARFVQPPQETARSFSELSKKNEEAPFTDTIRRLYPWIEKLSVEVHSGMNTLFASVKGLPTKLPLSAVSSGVERVVEYCPRDRDNGRRNVLHRRN